MQMSLIMGAKVRKTAVNRLFRRPLGQAAFNQLSDAVADSLLRLFLRNFRIAVRAKSSICGGAEIAKCV